MTPRELRAHKKTLSSKLRDKKAFHAYNDQLSKDFAAANADHVAHVAQWMVATARNKHFLRERRHLGYPGLIDSKRWWPMPSTVAYCYGDKGLEQLLIHPDELACIPTPIELPDPKEPPQEFPMGCVLLLIVLVVIAGFIFAK